MAENLLVVIPARGGSKRLPGKNSSMLAGLSLPHWTARAIQEAGIGGSCLLTTDNAELARIGESLGWLVPFLRPAELALDTVSSDAAILHALDWFRDDRGSDPELLMVLQVTSPLRGPECLRQGVEILSQRDDVDAVIGIRQLQVGSKNLYCRDMEGYLHTFMGEQENRPVLIPNGALYIIRTAIYREQRTFIPPRTWPLIMSLLDSLDIDTEEDWKMAETAILSTGQAPLTGSVVSRP